MIVVIRTVIDFFLSKEIESVHESHVSQSELNPGILHIWSNDSDEPKRLAKDRKNMVSKKFIEGLGVADVVDAMMMTIPSPGAHHPS